MNDDFVHELSLLKTFYVDLGFVVVDTGLSLERRAALALSAKSVLAQYGQRVVDLSGEKRGLDYGEGRSYWAADGWASMKAWPDLWRFYASLRPVLQMVTGQEVICSPHYRSAITVKAYADGDFHGLHRDTNPITALLYVTEGDPTRIIGRDADNHTTQAYPGDLLVMAGRELPHQVAASSRPNPRVVIAFNYYTPEDIWRPEDMDRVVYGT